MNNTERDTEGCRDLWAAVIKKAAQDLEFLAAADHNEIYARRYEKELREIVAQDPLEFVEGPWFALICDLIGLDPRVARRYFGNNETSRRGRNRETGTDSRRAA